MIVMKLNKIVTAAFAVLTLTAASCTKEPSAPGNATVGFPETEIEFGMGNEYIHIPIRTTGEAGAYPILVTVAVKAYDGEFAAVEDVDYMITSKEILVASPESAPNVEVKLVNPGDADELRFVLTIASYENAAGVSVGETLVKCAKNDLDRLCGTWTWTGTSEGESYEENWTISNDGSSLQISGTLFSIAVGSNAWLEADYDPDNRVISFGIGPANYYVALQSGSDVYYVAPVICNAQGKAAAISGNVVGEVNETLDEIHFTDIDELGFLAGAFNPNTNAYAGYFYGPFFIDGNTIRKVKK